MYRNMKDLINDVFRDVTIDKKFIQKLDQYIYKWKYKKSGSADHASFLGGNLIGVDKIIFSDADAEQFYKNIVYQSEDRMKDAYSQLDGINTSFNVASNPFYLTNVTLMHMVYVSKLSNFEKNKALEDLGLIIGFKMFSSMYNHFFSRSTSTDISKAVYENLNGKYILKKYGTWYDVFVYRANDVKPKGIFEAKLKSFSVDDAVKVVTGIHTRFKDMLINLYREVLSTMENNDRITLDSKIVSGDGDETSDMFKDTVSEHVRYVQFIKSVINSETDLVNDSYIYLITHVIPRCSKDKLEELLLGLSKVPYPTDPNDDYVEKILVSSFAYLTSKGITNGYYKQVQKCLVYLKNYWSAGNIKDPVASEAKKMSIYIVENIIGTKNRNIIPSIAIGFTLYIFCLAIANHKE
nr:MAG TPA: hypothetical protein [Caudoviricetes sp.]